MLVTKIKINGVPKEKDFNALPFGRKIEHNNAIAAFKATAKTTHVSQKRKTSTTAWREFVKLYEPTEYYATFHDGAECRDDSYQVWYK